MNKITYNQKEKILSIKISEEPSVDSDIRGNVVIDYNQNGDITNVEIMSFSLDEFKDVPKFKQHPVLTDRFSIIKERA